jgi:hypothetical protein
MEPTEPLDRHEVLRRVAGLPISSWSYLWDRGEVRHVGPMAQDFNAAFGFEEDGGRIDLARAQAVALAAIQALHELVTEQGAQIAELRARLEQLTEPRGE